MAVLTAEAVVDRIVPSKPRVSPDGRWVVFVTAPVGRAGKHPVSTLWLAPAEGGEPPSELAGGVAGHREPRWAPDSGSVFFLSDAAGRGTAQLYRVGVAGREAERLTDRPAGISGHAPLPDGESVVLIAPDDEPVADPRVRVVPGESRGGHGAPPDGTPRDGHTWDTQTRPDRLWLLDLRTTTTRPLGDLGRRHVREVAVRPDGTTLAVFTWSVADRAPGVFAPGLHLVDAATGETRDQATPALEASDPAWWHDHDGWHLAYLGLTPPGLVGGTAVFEGRRNLTAGLTVCPTELVQVDDGPPLAVFAEGLDTTVRRLDPATRTFTKIADVPGAALSASRDGHRIAVVGSGPTEPDEVHAGPPDALTKLSATGPEGIRWGARERLRYRAPDGLDLDGLLILPPGKSRRDGPFPLVTLVHGGPHDRYADRFHLGWYPSGQWLAAAGFAVFLPNARGGLGHGHDFAAKVAGDVGGAEFTDVLTGIDLLVAGGVADGTRLGIGGWSHGGFFAAWAVTQTDRFAAAVVGAGVTDWPLLAATGEHSRFEAALGGRENSPVTHAHRIRTPVLILHGEDDTNVPLSQAELLHRALGGKHHEYVVYPRENHSIRERGHQLDVLRRTRAWFSHLLA
ncbi:S9 family peptidase [Amycolatopsis australiensis]|uniref:Dipeptidyl aminopeptidase/acylaminoacyl peptidase n=1 Tax=Amycolatopsis australiensis TaxID=546364 RepID=A0A1K1SG77_9PSEU|nr:S9 family peptidase [Amycolatopsis australiensis]SFW83379.1 Dipeptidyl aminopeptidase/acylaminoacyl peptidase [Amycolatopsis australiensis]